MIKDMSQETSKKSLITRNYLIAFGLTYSAVILYNIDSVHQLYQVFRYGYADFIFGFFLIAILTGIASFTERAIHRLLNKTVISYDDFYDNKWFRLMVVLIVTGILWLGWVWLCISFLGMY